MAKMIARVKQPASVEVLEVNRELETFFELQWNICQCPNKNA